MSDEGSNMNRDPETKWLGLLQEHHARKAVAQ